jgi:hypothetical protein
MSPKGTHHLESKCTKSRNKNSMRKTKSTKKSHTAQRTASELTNANLGIQKNTSKKEIESTRRYITRNFKTTRQCHFESSTTSTSGGHSNSEEEKSKTEK